jgi:hypothetical protein
LLVTEAAFLLDFNLAFLILVGQTVHLVVFHQAAEIPACQHLLCLLLVLRVQAREDIQPRHQPPQIQGRNTDAVLGWCVAVIDFLRSFGVVDFQFSAAGGANLRCG